MHGFDGSIERSYGYARGGRRRLKAAAVVLAGGAAALGLAACFSSEPESTDPMGSEALTECISALPPAAGSGQRTVATINNFRFFGDSIVVAPGTTVTWVNCEEPVENAPGATSHTVTSDDSDGPLDSSLLRIGESYSYTFEEVGTFPYHCTPHPFMQAVVVVEEET